MNEALLKELSEACGVPSREGALRTIVQRELAPFVDSMSTDSMGNVIGFKKGSGGPKVMIAAHMDEIGFIIKHIDDNGFVRLQPLGGFDPRQLFAQRVLVHPRVGAPVKGVLVYNTKPTHLLNGDEANQPPKLDNFYVDLGMEGKAVTDLLRVGDMVTLDRTLERCGNCYIGKSLDNRVGVFVMLEAMRKLGTHACDIYPVATTQEEIGLRGATTAAYTIQPDIGVALDTTLATDYPGMSGQDVVTRLGKGAGIKIMDSSLICHPKLVDHFVEIAIKNNIPHQMEILPRGGTDGGAIQRSRGGAVTITLSVPTRYIHTVNEMSHATDIQAVIDLLAAYLSVAHEGNYAF